jgi:hypothetical protein
LSWFDMIVFSMDDTRSAEPPGRARARRGRGPETSGIPVTRIVEAQFCRVVTGGNHSTDTMRRWARGIRFVRCRRGGNLFAGVATDFAECVV